MLTIPRFLTYCITYRQVDNLYHTSHFCSFGTSINIMCLIHSSCTVTTDFLYNTFLYLLFRIVVDKFDLVSLLILQISQNYSLISLNFIYIVIY